MSHHQLSFFTVSFAVYAFLPIITVDVGTHCILVYRNVETITGNRLYHTFKAIMNYFIPIAISGFFYTKIFLTLMRMAPPGEVTKSSSGTAMNSSQKIRRQRLRGIRSAVLVLLLFTVCYLPTTVLSLWRAYDINFLDTEYYKYHLITGLISRINVIANPFIYSLSAASFKKQIAQMFGCCYCTCLKPNRREQSNVSSGNSREHTLSTE
ncbi:putative G-protein coupled receptor [Apostichopus japonicus]|uniref:Putative G-protein coupled receptor n=1 Tax=Stichopus japonicus TaxID=307972 RepID=A0A2G8L8X5_STIJA|nr:putative G-protein coupled receptor [Apostichopus japonicus]